MSNTGENEQGLRKIIDLTRLAGIFILLLHFYFYCYRAFELWGFQSTISDRLLQNIQHTGLFNAAWYSKVLSSGLLIISLIGAQGKKDEKLNLKKIIGLLLSGSVLFFCSGFLLTLNNTIEIVACIYMLTTGTGFILILSGGNLLSRLIKLNLSNDVFNSLNETFPQEERLLENEFSIHFYGPIINKIECGTCHESQ